MNAYKERLQGLSNVKIVEPNNESNHIPFRIVLICDEPTKGLIEYFTKNDIETRTVFYPLHKQPCYEGFGDDEDFKNSIFAYEHGVCLPSYPALTIDKVDYICNVIRKYYDQDNLSG